MKNIKYVLFSFILFLIFYKSCYAASVTLSVSSNSVYVGDTFTVYAIMKDAAAWNIHVNAVGNVSNCTINQVDASSDALDTSKTFTASCKATNSGEITITLSGDVTSSNDGVSVNVSDSKKVVATKKNVENNSNNNYSKLSNNNKIKQLTVSLYNVEKIDDNNYTLNVGYNVSEIDVNAILEDDKAKIEGVGVHQLNVGVNDIILTIISESSLQNKVKLSVTRRDGFYLDDLDNALSLMNDVNIIIGKNEKILSDDLEKIKRSGKTVSLNYLDENKNIIYSWIINSYDLVEINDFDTSVLYESEYKKEISKLSNYADGLYVNVKQGEGYTLKMFLYDNFEENGLINVYYYNKETNKLELFKEVIENDGYITTTIDKEGDYLVTMSKIIEKTVEDENKISIWFVLTFVFLLVIIILVLYIFIKNKKKSKNMTITPC